MGDSGERRRRWRRVVCALMLLLAVLAGGCGGEGAEDDTSSQRAAHERLMRLGERVFEEHCQTCHPLLGRPNGAIHDDYHPPLDLDQVSPAPGYARRIVDSGLVGMGGFAGSPSEERAVVAYVIEVSGSEVSPPAGVTDAELDRGRKVYDKYCQACHQLQGREPTDPNPIWVGTNFDELRPGVLLTERIVREGQREAMPSFDSRISRSGIRAVALYVNAVARGGRP